MVDNDSGDIDEGTARGMTGLIVGAAVGLLTWIAAYHLFTWLLGA